MKRITIKLEELYYKLRIAFIINRDRCSRCGSKDLRKGYFSRGFDSVLRQSSGDYGVRCFDCGKIKWNKSNQEDYECDCQDYENGLVSNYCPIHNENTYSPET